MSQIESTGLETLPKDFERAALDTTLAPNSDSGFSDPIPELVEIVRGFDVPNSNAGVAAQLDAINFLRDSDSWRAFAYLSSMFEGIEFKAKNPRHPYGDQILSTTGDKISGPIVQTFEGLDSPNYQALQRAVQDMRHILLGGNFPTSVADHIIDERYALALDDRTDYNLQGWGRAMSLAAMSLAAEGTDESVAQLKEIVNGKKVITPESGYLRWKKPAEYQHFSRAESMSAAFALGETKSRSALYFLNVLLQSGDGRTDMDDGGLIAIDYPNFQCAFGLTIMREVNHAFTGYKDFKREQKARRFATYEKLAEARDGLIERLKSP